jgi:hypothetical protein
MPSSADVTVLWGETLIAAAHVPEGRAISIADDGIIRRASTRDATSRAVVVRAKGDNILIARAGAKPVLLVRVGEDVHVAMGDPQASSVYRRPGALDADRLSLRVVAGARPPRSPRGPVAARSTVAAIAMAAAVHCVVLAASASTMPELSPEPDGDRLASVRETAGEPIDRPGRREAGDEDEDEDERALARTVQLCGIEAPVGGRSIEVQGAADNPDPHIANTRATRDGWPPPIGLEPETYGGDPKAPIMPFGRDDSFGNDARSASRVLLGAWSQEMAACFGVPARPWSCEDRQPVPPTLALVGLFGIGDGAEPVADGARWRRLPRVTVGPIQVAANVPRWKIASGVRSVAEHARSCYERALADQVLTSGAMDIVLRLRGDDVAVEVTALGDAADMPELSCCIEHAQSRLQGELPAGTRGTVRYTLGLGSWDHAAPGR